ESKQGVIAAKAAEKVCGGCTIQYVGCCGPHLRDHNAPLHAIPSRTRLSWRLWRSKESRRRRARRVTAVSERAGFDETQLAGLRTASVFSIAVSRCASRP